MAGHPLRSATDRRFGGPLPRQLPNQTRGHPIPPEFFTLYHAVLCAYAVLTVVSNWYPPEWGRFPTRYSPVRHSRTQPSIRKLQSAQLVRLACVKHAASVHPEPGSNSRKKFDQGPDRLLTFLILVLIPDICFTDVRPAAFVNQMRKRLCFPHCFASTVLKVSSLNKTFKNLQGCFTVQLSKSSFFVRRLSRRLD